MAQHTVTPPDSGFVDKRRANNKSAGVSANQLSANLTTAMASNDALDTRLAAINAGYYTAARLNAMTQNDKVYAIRLADDPTSI